MNRTIRIFLLWLLVLALPVQGFAAAVRLSCGTTHHHGFSALAVHHAHSHSSVFGDHQPHFKHEHSALASSGSDPSSSSHQVSASTCSDCAACCAGAVILPAVLNWAPMHASSIALVMSPSPPYSGYFPERLKRPPKHFLA
jgi:hypothetical protein